MLFPDKNQVSLRLAVNLHSYTFDHYYFLGGCQSIRFDCGRASSHVKVSKLDKNRIHAKAEIFRMKKDPLCLKES